MDPKTVKEIGKKYPKNQVPYAVNEGRHRTRICLRLLNGWTLENFEDPDGKKVMCSVLLTLTVLTNLSSS